MVRVPRIKFAQISDTHLVTQAGCRCWWMAESPERQLRQAIKQIQAIPDLDFVVFTGDLVDQADPASFAQFQTIAQELTVPYYLCVGNHDIDIDSRDGRYNRQQFMQWCQQQFAFQPAPTGFVDYSLSPCPGIRLIALDASLGTWPDPQGTIRPEQLAWLQAELKAHAQDWVILLIHQPPVASVLFRRYRILPEQASPLLDLLEAHGHVAAVLSGHLHLPKIHTRRRIPYLVCPPLVGPVSAFRVFELGADPGAAYGLLRYFWQRVPMNSTDPSPLWHGWLMGRSWDRWGRKRIRIPASWQSSVAAVAHS